MGVVDTVGLQMRRGGGGVVDMVVHWTCGCRGLGMLCVKASMGLDSTTCTKIELVASA